MLGLDYIQQWWHEHGLVALVGLSLAFLLIYAIYRKFKGEKGTWAKSYYIPVKKPSPTSPQTKPSTESKGEAECRRALQYLFGKPFNKARPNFLRNPVTGGSFNLELDCYQEDLRLAVEYSGRQHYEYIPYFHRNKEAFLNQKYRDHMKAQMCKENGINLVIIPYSVRLQDIKKVLEGELRRLGYQV